MSSREGDSLLMTIPGHSLGLLTQSRLLQWYLAPLRAVSASSLETAARRLMDLACCLGFNY